MLAMFVMLYRTDRHKNNLLIVFTLCGSDNYAQTLKFKHQIMALSFLLYLAALIQEIIYTASPQFAAILPLGRCVSSICGLVATNKTKQL